MLTPLPHEVASNNHRRQVPRPVAIAQRNDGRLTVVLARKGTGNQRHQLAAPPAVLRVALLDEEVVGTDADSIKHRTGGGNVGLAERRLGVGHERPESRSHAAWEGKPQR